MMRINATELSINQLEGLLADRKKQEKNRRARARMDYEIARDTDISSLLDEAAKLHFMIRLFKSRVHQVMAAQAQKTADYGLIPATSKGGFSLTNKTGNKRVTRRRDTDPVWDERAVKAIGLIKDFLCDTVKKRDVKLFEILLSFLERNQNGDLEYARVFNLMQHEDKFDDVRWTEGLRLLKESYSITLKGFAYDFKLKNDAGKWDRLELNFSSL
ncbi:DUF3164 family protein [Pedobacter lusitanus]|nr:DUF3164 family protein [Pedobacter lusitanus]